MISVPRASSESDGNGSCGNGHRHTDSTATLIRLARDGHAQARERLAARYLSMLRGWARGRGLRARGWVDTDDLVQMALCRAFRTLETFEFRGEEPLQGYLRRILRNQIRDEARRASRQPEHVPLDEEISERAPSALEALIGEDAMRRYRCGLLTLTAPQRRAVTLRLEGGLRYREIADTLGLPTANAARALVTRALARLCKALE